MNFATKLLAVAMLSNLAVPAIAGTIYVSIAGTSLPVDSALICAARPAPNLRVGAEVVKAKVTRAGHIIINGIDYGQLCDPLAAPVQVARSGGTRNGNPCTKSSCIQDQNPDGNSGDRVKDGDVVVEDNETVVPAPDTGGKDDDPLVIYGN